MCGRHRGVTTSECVCWLFGEGRLRVLWLIEGLPSRKGGRGASPAWLALAKDAHMHMHMGRQLKAPSDALACSGCPRMLQ